MQILRIGTTYIVLIWLLTILLFGSVLVIGYHRNMDDLRHLMNDEGNQLIDIVTISAQVSIHSLDEVEDITARRLLDNARLIEEAASGGMLTDEDINHITRQNDLSIVAILDSTGSEIAGNGLSSEYPERLAPLFEAVERVLAGKSEEETIGFAEGTYYSDKLYGVVVKSRSGGAVALTAPSDEMLDFRRAVGLGTLLREIGNREHVRYIVLQDIAGIVAASPGVREMNRIADDPFLLEAKQGGPYTRLDDSTGERVFEIVKPLIVDNIDLGLLRIGLDIGTFEAIRSRAIRHFIILFVASVLSGAFLFIIVILRQNYRILNREHDRILSDVRKMEEETRRSERLASMGRLAGGVAHEIRNPLNSISIITQRLETEFTPAEGIEEYRSFLKTIGSEINRIQLIIEHFLTYIRPPKLRLETVDIAVLVRETVRVVQEKARLEGIGIRIDIEKGLTYRCDPDQMKQMLLNLLLNAIDAVGGDGEIRIDAGRRNRYIEITVKDTGPGIPDDIREQIFDPYFTTKEHGSGLGLSEVHRIVGAHKGNIRVENGDGYGAVFTIRLPVSGGRG